MGLSSSKTTSGPSKQAMPYLQSGSTALQGAYDANKGNTAAIGNTLTGAFNDYSSTMGDSLDPAKAYNADVLGGKYLDAGNPYLEGVISSTNNDVQDRVNALFSSAGQTGSSRQIGELGKQLSTSENNLRYTDYNDRLGQMDSAVTAATGLSGADNSNISTLANLGTTAANVPWIDANNLAAGLGGLWGNSTTTKSSQGLGSTLLGVAGAGLGGWASGGFK
jgi:hypothetical protein